MSSLYVLLKSAGCELDNHYSDLYVKVTPASTAIVQAWRQSQRYLLPIGTFVSQIDGCAWYDFPFQFDPYWEAKRSEKGTEP